MHFVQFIYGVFFVVALFAAIMVVLSPHAVYSALYLVLTMLSIGGLFVLMNAQLAAAFQVIVYAGAIMVLFLFVIMLLNVGHGGGAPSERTRGIRWWGAVFAIGFVAQLITAVARLTGIGAAPAEPAAGGAAVPAPLAAYSLDHAQGISIDHVARLLVTDYLYAFEMTSVLLLVAVIGAVILARRHLIQGVVDVDAAGKPAGEGLQREGSKAKL